MAELDLDPTEDAQGASVVVVMALGRGTSVGRYLILDPLGSGGMGAVYAAYDPELERRVAIKLLAQLPDEESSQGGTRLLREAQAMAQLRHPNVVAVYDVGTFEGQVFLAMELVEGSTLQQWLREGARSWREVVAVFVQVGRGLAAAHAQGLVHRDVKPTNILMAKDGSARLTDFGVARRVGGADEGGPPQPSLGAIAPLLDTPLTMAGERVGTPVYMAPEQLCGLATDARADQYGFCVSLYQALFGALPFAGPRREADAEASAPPANSPVPAWVRRIVMRGLSVAPDQRFRSLDELVAALERDPAAARRRWLARGAMLAGAAGLLAVAVMSYRALQTARVASAFGQEIKAIESTLRLAHVRPEHDISREKAAIADRMKAVEERMAAIGAAADGPGHYALGRGYLALDEHDRAREHLERAWNGGYRTAEVAYALGQTLGVLYQKELAAAEGIRKPQEREQRLREVEKSYRDPALAYLRQSRGIDAESPEYVEALVASYEKRYDEALQHAERAYSSSGWLYEAKALEGFVHAAIGLDQYRGGKLQDAVARYDQANAAFREAADVARSAPAIPAGLCLLESSRMEVEMFSGGGATQPHFEKGIEACDRALRIDPGSADAHRSKATLLRRMGESEQLAGKDPREKLDAAIAAARQHLRLRPDDTMGYYLIGASYTMLASYAQTHGIDPATDLGLATAALETGLQLKPDDYNLHNALAGVYGRQAEYELEKGSIDPRPTLSKGSDQLRRALAVRPDETVYLYNLGANRLLLAEYELAHGLDIAKSHAELVEAFERCLRTNPRFVYAHFGLGHGYLLKAEQEAASGADPDASIQKAIDAFMAALAIKPKEPLALGDAANAWCSRATMQIERGQSPDDALEQGRQLALRALAADPDGNSGLSAEWCLGLAEARWRMKQGQSPARSLDAALQAAAKAQAGNKSSSSASVALAEIWMRRAQWRRSEGRPAGEEISAGLAALDTALAASKQDARALALRGALLLQRAQASDRDGAAVLAEAQNALEQALAINGRLAREFGATLEETRKLSRVDH